MSEITASEQIRLDIIKKVNYDTAAAKLAIDWVGDSYLKSELFADSFDRVFTESEIVSKTRKAIQEATEALALFDTAAEKVKGITAGIHRVPVIMLKLLYKGQLYDIMQRSNQAMESPGNGLE
ncbi:Protein of uncharacterised function (DUF2560) [Klebsiella pneumoniae]|nr:Protein of uncharacterised function (DUF2560) [Klebsiella pneumoniae]SWV53847.1 Protein of uncharacterised function (DUF2560) [Klebsiella pneumoniae]VFZ13616.1 Protein of uncharacterised function (DUF2560) [Klebsiella pneumoniae]